MKKQSIFRISDKKGATEYTCISNKILQYNKLTWDEGGLLSFLLSLPKDFKVVQKNIIRKLRGILSAERVRRAWAGLVDKKHIVSFPDPKDNFKTPIWYVFETPNLNDTEVPDSGKPDSEIPDTGKPDNIQSIHLESTYGESKNIESIINTNTGPSILGKKIEKKSDPTFFYEEARKEAIQQLTGATILGEEILKYCTPEKHKDLLEKIGNIKYDLLSSNIDKYENAIRQLDKLKSSSTDGLAAPEPT